MNKLWTPNFAQENQAIKRQKLDAGKTRQVSLLLFIYMSFGILYVRCLLNAFFFHQTLDSQC